MKEVGYSRAQIRGIEAARQAVAAGLPMPPISPDDSEDDDDGDNGDSGGAGGSGPRVRVKEVYACSGCKGDGVLKKCRQVAGSCTSGCVYRTHVAD